MIQHIMNAVTYCIIFGSMDIDILDECSRNRRVKPDYLGTTTNFADYNFTVTTIKNNECNQSYNMTTFEAQVYLLARMPQHL
jgi:hypothetical protein